MYTIYKIPIDKLEVGMIVVKFNRSGFPYPYYGKPLQDISILEILRKYSVSYAYIQKADTVSTEIQNMETQAKIIVSDLIHEQEVQSPTLTDFKAVAELQRNAAKATTDLFEEVRIGKALNTGGLKEIVKTLVQQCFLTPEAFMAMSSLKNFDNYTFTHCVNVSVLSIAIGKKLGFSNAELTRIGLAGLLHDVGKMKIPTSVLNKPSRLDEDEYELMKKHPDFGYQILIKDVALESDILGAVRHHHEKTDGTGYPHGLFDRDIPKFAKIVSIADVYDAVTTERSYHKGMLPSDALKLIYSWSGVHFNPTLVKFFITLMGIYPVGTLIILNTNELAIVLEHSEQNPLKPKVLIISDTSMETIDPYPMDLSDEVQRYDGITRSIVSSLDPKSFSIQPNKLLEEYQKL